MACIVSNMNVSLPALRSLIVDPSSSSPPSPSIDKQNALPPSKDKNQNDRLYSPPRLPFSLSSHNAVHGDHRRRVSTCSISSAPSLTYSPSPSPPPTRPASPDSFLLVPCAFHIADAVVIIADQHLTARDGCPSSKSTASPRLTPPIFRPCRPSEARATLLIGPAISAHARKSAASGERRMHPYRIMRERRDSR